MSEKKSFHMTSEEFRQCGRDVIDWIADYYERIETFSVLSQIQPDTCFTFLTSGK